MSSFLNALNKINTSKLPVWFMRQAGRYLPEYMAVKNKSSFREMSHTPEIMKEITLQPLKRYPLDAAIMFSDILTCLEFMGAPFEFTDKGPKLDNHGPQVLSSLKDLNPAKDLTFVGKGIELIVKESPVPVIGFVGAPFTLISYLVEGGTSKEFIETKKVLLNDTSLFRKSMEHISNQLLTYLDYQVRQGVSAVQIFDSWVGVLSQAQYKNEILPHMQNLIGSFKKLNPSIPLILYSQPTSHLVELLSESGADALSVDWRTPVDQIAQRTSLTIQGNLDPIVTTLSWEKAKPHVDDILEKVSKSSLRNRFIFNVGHGVTPQTKPETIGQIIDYVHKF